MYEISNPEIPGLELTNSGIEKNARDLGIGIPIRLGLLPGSRDCNPGNPNPGLFPSPEIPGLETFSPTNSWLTASCPPAGSLRHEAVADYDGADSTLAVTARIYKLVSS
jgi:hypothetical protein